jgi:polysaccharide biosynthesis/export protein
VNYANRLGLPVLLLSLSLTGCGDAQFLSQSGPSRDALITGASLRVTDPGQTGKTAYALVPLDATISQRLQTLEVRTGLSGMAPARRTGGQIGVGDIIAVTIFEADSGGMFLPKEPGTRSGNFVSLPNQQVDSTGHITIPYAGLISVVGLTPEAVEKKIVQQLSARALEPQVVVTVAQRIADPVSVLGDVTTAAHFSLDPGGERILGAIARAGGPRFPAYETYVSLQRGGQVERALMSDIAQDPAQNVELQRGDTVYVSHEPRYYLALGATGLGTSLGPVDRRISFGDSRLSLADAIAHGGGLADDRANARGAFVYRFESPTVLEALGVAGAHGLSGHIPTLYMVDLSKPAGYFDASRFQMRSEDVLYVSNSPSTDVAKILSLLLPGSGTAAAVNAATK